MKYQRKHPHPEDDPSCIRISGDKTIVITPGQWVVIDGPMFYVLDDAAFKALYKEV